jgi:aspartate racemase
MKKIGLLGGLAWPATIGYYKAICQMSQRYHSQFEFNGPSPMPEMCIESVNINYSYNHRGRIRDDASWKEYDKYFNSALKKLEMNGVDFAIITANTLHTRFDAITKNLNIPVLSIYEAIANECKRHKINQFLLLGTEPTMKSNSMPEFMAARHIDAFPPSEQELQSIVTSLISELFQGEIKTGRIILKDVIESAYKHKDVTQKSVCLACTELPLAFSGKEQKAIFVEEDVTYLNTTIIHAKAAFDYAVQETR